METDTPKCCGGDCAHTPCRECGGPVGLGALMLYDKKTRIPFLCQKCKDVADAQAERGMIAMANAMRFAQQAMRAPTETKPDGCPECGSTKTILHGVAAEPDVGVDGGLSTLCADCGAELKWESDAEIKADRENLREAAANGN